MALSMVISVDDDIHTVGDYNRIIIGMRGLMKEDSVSGRDEGGATVTRPMLTLDRSGDPSVTNFSFVDINFTRVRREGSATKRHDVKVRFLRDNLYAVGFQSAQQQWREFEWDFYKGTQRRPRYLPNSQYITGYNGSYGSIPLSLVSLGGQGLRAALDALIDNSAMNTPAANRLLAGGMGTMAVMFSEAARFDPILYHVLREFQLSPGVNSDSWVLERAQRWARYSGWTRYYLAHPNEKWELMKLKMSVVPPGKPPVVTEVSVKTPVQLLTLMGILHNSPEYVRARGPHDNY